MPHTCPASSWPTGPPPRSAAPPPDSDSLRALGVALAFRGDHPSAIACFRRALEADPAHTPAWLALARSLASMERFQDAAAAALSAAGLSPLQPEPHFESGRYLYLAGEVAAASEAFGRSILTGRFLAPRQRADCWYHLGVTSLRQNRMTDALAAFGEAVALDPGHAPAANNLGIVRQTAGDSGNAERAYRLALSADPSYAQARYNLAFLLQQTGQLEEALVEYETLLRAEPRHLEARNNFGNTLLALARPQDARKAFDRVLAVAPDDARARWNRSLAALVLGDWRAGWADHDWRFRQPESSPRGFTVPVWQGEPLEGRRILLWAEQGLGDAIQFLRFAPQVAASGGRVLVECPATLVALAKRLESVEQVFAAGTPLPAFDLHCPLLSLPHRLGVTLDSLPPVTSYLSADPSLVRQWSDVLGQHSPRGRRVGLVWAGNPLHRNDLNRSLQPSDFAPLARLDRVSFFGLQFGSDEMPPGLSGHSLGRSLRDFSDTAAVVSQLDLVISADTSTAHLAGALGVPVWTLVPHAPDWRWLLDRTDSPWYPTMRLYRQSRRGDWASAVARARADLIRWLPP